MSIVQNASGTGPQAEDDVLQMEDLLRTIEEYTENMELLRERGLSYNIERCHTKRQTTLPISPYGKVQYQILIIQYWNVRSTILS